MLYTVYYIICDIYFIRYTIYYILNTMQYILYIYFIVYNIYILGSPTDLSISHRESIVYNIS